MNRHGVLGIVPARGGSKGIPLKNLQLVDGLPLFLHAADLLRPYCDTVVVSTDHPDIESAARVAGYQVHVREEVPDEQTIMEAAAIIAEDLKWFGPVFLLQPTCAFINLWKLIQEARISAEPLVAGVEERHQIWQGRNTPLLARVNRQQLAGSHLFREVGFYFWPEKSVVGDVPERVVPLRQKPGGTFDIDTPAELQAVKTNEEGGKSILVLYAESEAIGTGHRRRMETLAAALPHHYVDLAQVSVLDVEIGDTDYDLIITDRLDNDFRPRGETWISFEDCGEATKYADAVVNALYPSGYSRSGREFNGPDWAILRPEFWVESFYSINDFSDDKWLDSPVGLPRILVMFGGTDPAKMGTQVADALGSMALDVTVVRPGDNLPIASLMLEHDLLITSAGRTVYEAARIGIPTLVYPANAREATHVHIGPKYGNLLGTQLPGMVDSRQLQNYVLHLLRNADLRESMSETARKQVDGRGLERCVWLVESVLKGMPV